MAYPSSPDNLPTSARPVTWTWFDDALLHSCYVVSAFRDGRPDLVVSDISASFPPSLGQHERLLVHGAFSLSDHQAAGDGTYMHDSGFFFASGGAGLAVTGVVAGARAIGNASRRARAAQDAVPRWIEIDRGSIIVGTHGFYLQSALGHREWGWDSITLADMVGPDHVHLVGVSTTGPVSWIVSSPWSPLLFALWCLARHPEHPRFVSGGWLPPGWWDRAIASGRRPAPVAGA